MFNPGLRNRRHLNTLLSFDHQIWEPTSIDDRMWKTMQPQDRSRLRHDKAAPKLSA